MDNRALAALMPEGSVDVSSPLWSLQQHPSTVNASTAASRAARASRRRRTLPDGRAAQRPRTSGVVGGLTLAARAGQAGGRKQVSGLRRLRRGGAAGRPRSTAGQLSRSLGAGRNGATVLAGTTKAPSRGGFASSGAATLPMSHTSRHATVRLRKANRTSTIDTLTQPAPMRKLAVGGGGSGSGASAARQHTRAQTAPLQLPPAGRHGVSPATSPVQEGAVSTSTRRYPFDASWTEAIHSSVDGPDTGSLVAPSPLNATGGSRPQSRGGSSALGDSLGASSGFGSASRPTSRQNSRPRTADVSSGVRGRTRSPPRRGAGSQQQQQSRSRRVTRKTARSKSTVPGIGLGAVSHAVAFGGKAKAEMHARRAVHKATNHPTIHFLPECEEAMDPATRQAVMHEWVSSYTEEHEMYNSVAVKNLAKLRRAAVFGSRLERPNSLETAVAFEVLEELSSVFGRYRTLLEEITSTLRRAVYEDAVRLEGPVFMNEGAMATGGDGDGDGDGGAPVPESTLTPQVDEVVGLAARAAAAEAPAGANDDAATYHAPQHMSDQQAAFRIRQYIACNPFFASAQEMESERAQLMSAAASLREEVQQLEMRAEQLEDERRNLVTVGNVVDVWQRGAKPGQKTVAMFASRVRKRLNKVKSHILRSAASHREMALLMHSSSSANAVDDAELQRLLLSLSDAQRRRIALEYTTELEPFARAQFLRSLLEMNPDSARAIAKHCVERLLDVPTACSVVTQMLSHRPDLEVKHVYQVVQDTLRGPNVAKHLGARAKILEELMLSVANKEDRVVCLEALLDSRTDGETSAILRMIAGFDKNLDVEGTSIAGLRAGFFQGVGSGTLAVPLTGKYDVAVTKRVLGVASTEACELLLLDAFSTLGQGCMATIHAALQQGGELHNVFQALGDDAKTDFVRSVLSMVDHELLCPLITCPYHDHSRPLPHENGSDSDDDMYVARSHSHRKRQKKKKAKKGSAKEGGKSRRSSMSMYMDMDVPRPWERYLRKPPRSLQLPRLQMAQALSLIYECYEKKLLADQADDRVGNRRDSMAEFVRLFLLQRYGLTSIMNGYLFTLVQLLRLNETLSKKKSIRLHVFAVGCGVSDGSAALYSDRTMHIVLNLLKQIFPKFNANSLANRKEGRSFVTLGRAINAINVVFPESGVPFNAVDRMTIPRDSRDALLSKLQGMGVRLSAAEEMLQQQMADKLAAAKRKRYRSGQRDKAPGGSGVGSEVGAGAGGDAGAGASAGSSAQSLMSATMSSSRQMKGGSKLVELVDTDAIGDVAKDTMVVDMDVWLLECVNTCQRQLRVNMSRLRKLYKQFDVDKSGSLEYGEFQLLVQACTEEVLPAKTLLQLFEEVNMLDGPQSGDTVSPEAFAFLCAQHGLVAPEDM